MPPQGGIAVYGGGVFHRRVACVCCVVCACLFFPSLGAMAGFGSESLLRSLWTQGELAGIPADTMKAVTRRDAVGTARSGRYTGRRSGPLAGRVQAPVSFDRVDAAIESPVLPDFEIAQKVFHPKFGTGIVTEVVKLKNDVEVAVEFKRHGKKRLMASLARLEPVEED